MKYIKKFNEQIDNFTARYYDFFDDEVPNESDQMYEGITDNYTFECSGSPKPYFNTKQEFFDFMGEYGFKHTTLTKSTNMLIVADEDLGTLKCKKAEKYGIPVYTYRHAKKEMKNLAIATSKYNM